MKRIRLRVQWPDGTSIPVMFRVNSMGHDIVNMLGFVKGPRQEISVSHRGVTLEESCPLTQYGVKENDVLQVSVHPNITAVKKMMKVLDAIAESDSDNMEDHDASTNPDNWDDNEVGVVGTTGDNS